MSNKEYDNEQIRLLKINKYVKNCTSKYITFTDEIKIEALKLDNKGMYFRDIFKHLGFPDFIINSDVPKNAIKGWKRRIKNKGLSGLIQNKKGRKKGEKIDISKMNKDEYIEYLETKNAYLEEIHKVAYGHYP